MTAPAVLRCPNCKTGALPVTPAPTTECATCGHRTATAYVQDALNLDQWIGDATARRNWLDQRIAIGDLTPAVAPPGIATAPASGPSARHLLYALGGLLLTGAAIFFLGVAWAVMPASARPSLLVAFACTLIAAGEKAASRLRGLGETLTTVGALVAVGAALAAPSMFDWNAYWADETDAAWAAGVFAASAGYALIAPRLGSSLTSWRCLSVAFTSAAVVCAAISVNEAAGPGTSMAPWMLVMLVGAVLLALLPRFTTAERRLSVAAAASITSIAAVGTMVAFTEARYWDVAIITGTAALAAFALAALTPKRQTWLWPLASAAATTACVSSVATANITATIAASLGVAVILLIGSGLTPRTVNVTSPAGHARLTAAAVAATLALTFAGIINSANIVAVILLTLTVALLTVAVTATTDVPVWRNCALLAAITGPAAWVVWWESSIDALAPWAAWGHGGSPVTVESRTVPAGLIAAACVAVWAYRYQRDTGTRPSTSRWLTWPLSVALVPGAFVGLGDAAAHYLTDTPSATRALVYLMIGAAIAAAGGALRLGGLALTGMQVTAIAALGVVVGIATVMPGWVALAFAGTLLVAAAARWEHLGARGRSATAWVAALN